MLKAHRFVRISRFVTCGGWVLLCAMSGGPVAAQTTDGGLSQGPIRLRQPASNVARQEIDCGNPASMLATAGSPSSATRDANGGSTQGALDTAYPNLQADYRDASRTDRILNSPNDSAQQARRNADGSTVADEKSFAREPVDTFEAYLKKLGIRDVHRFGHELVTPRSLADCLDGNTLVPPDYAIAPGDELSVTMWGSVDADMRLMVDRSGRISIPRVGSIMVSGVTYGALPNVILQRAERVFKNVQLSVSIGQLRAVRVYVTGYVRKPGVYTVNSLSTVASALLKAGGPSASGTFRNIQLRRANQPVANFDLYDLLIKGDRTSDRLIAADDVIQVGPVGTQVALVGAVNKPAIFEVRAGETLKDVLSMAGGMGAVADRSRLAVERLVDRTTNRVTELALPSALSEPPVNGDVYRAFSAVDAVLPVALQNKRVRVEGEVVRPGDYVLPPSTSIEDAIKAAGGMTQGAYVFGTEFSRESVRLSQQENYERALRDLETSFARAGTQRALSADEAAAQTARSAATQRLIERLRALKPTGRIVLQLPTTGASLPNLALEDGDRIYIPAKPTSVGVFGSVYNGGSYLFGEARKVADFLALAGGPTKGADTSGTFILRANGSVISNSQKAGFLGFGSGLSAVPAEPGDTIFVPEEINKTTWTQDLKEWTQILYQFGIGAAAYKTLKN